MWRPPATAACCSGRCARSCGRARLSTCLTTRATCASGIPPQQQILVSTPCRISYAYFRPRSVQPCPAGSCWSHAKPRALSLLWSDLLTSWGCCTFEGCSYCNRYKLGKVLGAGSFGIVREATERKTGRRYACKTIPKVSHRSCLPAVYCRQHSNEVYVVCLSKRCGKPGAC